MNPLTLPSRPEPPPLAPKATQLALAAAAFSKYRSQCFWFLSPDFEVNAETIPTIVAGLRKYGDRSAYVLAAELCR